MKTYPDVNWKELGRWVASARLQAGFTDTKEWAAQVGRSTRMLLGLERGEPVGAKTIEAVAEALGVANWSLFHILESGQSEESWTDAKIDQARRQYEAETGLEADSSGREPRLYFLSDEELLAELARRLAGRVMNKTERAVQAARAENFEGGDGNADAANERGSASTSQSNYELIAHDEEHTIESEQGHDETS